mgnify:CR=1 FL=1
MRKLTEWLYLNGETKFQRMIKMKELYHELFLGFGYLIRPSYIPNIPTSSKNKPICLLLSEYPKTDAI